MKLRVTILGSGTVVPCADRKATSILVEAEADTFLMDCGPGALDAVEKAGYSYRSIHKVFLTHFHVDHTLDLGRLFSALKNDGNKPVDEGLFIGGPPGLSRFVDAWNGLFPSITSGIEMSIKEFGDEESLDLGGVTVHAKRVRHRLRPALAYRVFYGDSDFVYTGDAAYSEDLASFADSTDLLVCECSFPDSLPAEGHMTPSLVGKLADAAGAGQVLLVHMYPVFGNEDPADGVRSKYKGKVAAARDGMRIDLAGR